jgi:hypothetical protein
MWEFESSLGRAVCNKFNSNHQPNTTNFTNGLKMAESLLQLIL